MEISHEEYLRRILNSKRTQLNELTVNHRINVAVFNDKMASLSKDIDSLESQMNRKEV